MGGNRERLLSEQHQPPTNDRWDARIQAGMAADQSHELANFADQTGGRLNPELAYVRRFASHLAVGEVAIEPALGSARVANIDHDGDHATITWKDDYGTSTASARYT